MKKTLNSFGLAICIMLASPQTFYANDIDENVSIGMQSDKLHSTLENIYKNNTSDESIEKAIRSLVDNLDDKYSEYFSEEDIKSFNDTLSNNVHHLGVVVFENNQGDVEISSVINNSIAYSMGLKTGDKILSINDTKVTTSNISELVNNTNKNDKLSLCIQSGNKKLSIAISIQPNYSAMYKNVSDLIDINNINSNIGYIDINIINDKTYSEFKEAMDKAIKNGNDKIILDLRGNVGGLLEDTVKICQKIIPEGPIAYLKNSNGERTEFISTLKNPPFKKIVVLTDKNTASGSEIISSAVKESGIGITIGTNTYGKGSAQEVIPLPSGDFIKVTTDEFFSRDGNRVNGIGVKPSILVEPISLLNENTKADLSLNDTFKKLGYVSPAIKTKTKTMIDIKNAIKKIKTINNLQKNDILDSETINIINNDIYDYILNTDEVLITAYNYLNS